MKLLEDETFVKNRVSTSWLDNLISLRDRSDKVAPHLATICGSVYKAAKLWDDGHREVLAAIEKGQTPHKSHLATFSLVEFIYDGLLAAIVLNCVLQGFNTR